MGWCYFIGNMSISFEDTTFYPEGSIQEKSLPDTFEKLTYNFLLVSPMENAYSYEIYSLYIEYKNITLKSSTICVTKNFTIWAYLRSNTKAVF